jgi:hypothetical protein
MQMQVGSQKQLNQSSEVFTFVAVFIQIRTTSGAIHREIIDVFVTEIFFHQFSVFDELLNAQQRLNFLDHLVKDLKNSADLNLKFEFSRRFFAVDFVVI